MDIQALQARMLPNAAFLAVNQGEREGLIAVFLKPRTELGHVLLDSDGR